MALERIEDGSVVTISYILTVDGEEVDRADADDPMVYLQGADNIVPGLESALAGRGVGDKLSVTVKPEDGYGEYDADEIEHVAREDIPDADLLQPGMVIEMEDDEGYLYDATVVELTPEEVVLDFNPVLAGKTLAFEVEVLEIREADEEELAHGHPHGTDDDEDDDDFDEDDDFSARLN